MSLPTTPRLPAPPSPRLALAISAALLAGYGSAHAATYPVTVSDDPGDGSVAGTLSHAIRAANLNPRADLIELQTDVTVKGVMKTLIDGAPSGGDHDTGGGDLILQSAAGSTHSISGNDQFRPLFIKSGTVTLKNLTIRNGLAKGGYARWGGAGAGLGGGLFVYDGTVLIDNVTFNNNQAVGGNGGNSGHNGGSGMFGNSTSNGGGGLFAASNAGNGGYGGNGHYGGAGGVENNNGDGGHGGFGGGGGNSRNGNNGGDGGFGGGGGYGRGSNGGNGGFGGGGGYGWRGNGGNGGFGGGGGGSGRSSPGYGGYGGGNDTHGGGGGGAGFGGAIFAMKGTLTLKDVSFSGNAVTAGVGNRISLTTDDGQARAKDVFICTSSLGFNHFSAALCAATVNQCGTTSTNEVVGTFGTTCPYTITTTAAPVAGGTVTCDPNPVAAAGNTSCTATPNSSYVFSSWSGACSGTASCTLSNVTANQNVTGHFKQLQTVAFAAATPTNKTFGDAAFAVTVTTTASGLTATLGSSTPTVCSVSANTVTLLATGTCTLTANQAGNDNYAAATEVRHQITVDQALKPIADDVSLTQQGIVIPNGDTTPSPTDGTDFGSTPIIQGRLTQTFTLNNPRTTPITIQSISVQETASAAHEAGLDGWALLGIQSAYAIGASDFSLDTATPFTIPQGASQNFTLNFSPSALGVREGIVIITFSDASIFPFAIRGTGTASASIPIFSPVGLLALLGGLAWFGRRRKRG